MLIVLDVELPNDYDEADVDDVISEAIYDLDGQVIGSKEYKKIVLTNL